MEHADKSIRIGEGVQAEVFLQEDGSVLKLWRGSADHSAVEREASVLRALANHPGIAPALRAVIELDGRPGLVMERIEGDGLDAALRSRPWTVGRIASALAACHARVHAIPASNALPDLNDDLRQRISASDDRFPALVDYALDVLDGLPRGDRVCHGDFHVANVLGALERLTVIDWPNATCGDPDADVAHTHMLHRFGRPREGTSRVDRVAVNVGRRVFAARYLSAYQSGRSLDNERFRRWETVRAAARLSAEVADETQRLVTFIERRRAADEVGA